MMAQMDLGGIFTLPDKSLSIKRVGYGAMQLAGPQVWGPPRDIDAAIEVLREAVAAGVNHIDTSDYYGPHVPDAQLPSSLWTTPLGEEPMGKLEGKIALVTGGAYSPTNFSCTLGIQTSCAVGSMLRAIASAFSNVIRASAFFSKAFCASPKAISASM
jgi:hypothetical protein